MSTYNMLARVLPLPTIPALDRTGPLPEALLFDARAADLTALHRSLHQRVRDVPPSGRVIVLGTPGHRALEGFTRSLAKELGRKGATANLVYAEPGAGLATTLAFLGSPRSAYVDGQAITVRATDHAPCGRHVVVTGGARGIGAAIARVLRDDGATVTTIDVRGAEISLDITTPDAPQIIADLEPDVVVHNAGITRDRTLGRMTADEWDAVLEVNLLAPLRINEALPDTTRVIGVSSISGIAGNAGQCNYATSKAGIIGMVDELTAAGRHANAVAPGFIETDMTAKMPRVVREAGRRMNSLRQGGRPEDVAHAVAWLADPRSTGVVGNVVRVCGQSLLGA